MIVSFLMLTFHSPCACYNPDLDSCLNSKMKTCTIPGYRKRQKRSIKRRISSTFSRVIRGANRIISGYALGVMKGINNMLIAGKLAHNAIDSIIKDILEDIDNRINKGRSDEDSSFFQNEDIDDLREEEDENLLNKYCFEDLYGPKFGLRSLLDYEKVCEEGSECQLNIDQFTDNENDKDILDLLEEKGKNAKDFILVSPCVIQVFKLQE